jgi:hypothetical protein
MKTRNYSIAEQHLLDVLEFTNMSDEDIRDLIQTVWNDGFCVGKEAGYELGWKDREAGEE